MAIWDPIEVIARIGSPAVIIVAAVVVLCAQLHTNMAANIVSPANDFSHLSPRRISFVTGGVITAVIGILMLPWKLYSDASAYIFTWLVGYSSLMGALGGILIADYWIIRRQQLSVPDLFREDGRYSYTNGVNVRAILVLIISIAPVVPGFIRAAMTPGGQVANPSFLDSLYTYAWFVTFALSFVLYLIAGQRSTLVRHGSLMRRSDDGRACGARVDASTLDSQRCDRVASQMISALEATRSPRSSLGRRLRGAHHRRSRGCTSSA